MYNKFIALYKLFKFKKKLRRKDLTVSVNTCFKVPHNTKNQNKKTFLSYVIENLFYQILLEIMQVYIYTFLCLYFSILRKTKKSD